MARIERYENDEQVSLDDRILGSDREGNSGTKNYPLRDVLDLFVEELPPTAGGATKTSELINDGEDETSTFVEHDELGAVATSNDYNDLDNKPIIPTVITSTAQIDNEGADDTSTYVEHDELGSVATSNNYNDLDNLPTIPVAPTKTSDLTNDGADNTSTYVEHDELDYLSLNQIVITTAVDIDIDTQDASSNSQEGRVVVIDNGVNNINYNVNSSDGFVCAYMKTGTGTVTFVQGAGRALNQVDGTAVLDGGAGSTATINSVGLVDWLRISNV